MKIIKIAVVDDSDFYNRMITNELENYTSALAIEGAYRFSIESYLSAGEFIKNLDNDLSIAFIDYYLGGGITAEHLIKTVKQNCKKCRIAILSQVKSIKTSSKPLTNGASVFIYKDRFAPANVCFFVDKFFGLKRNEKIGQGHFYVR